MFDMAKVGKTIARLRKAGNMTQMQLADRLGVSFQAISNWECGKSMPDISKLPEIAELFGVSVDEILGKENPVIHAVVDGREVHFEHYSVGDISEAGVLLQPQQVWKIVDSCKDQPQRIAPLLPFLDDASIEKLVYEYIDAGRGISVLLPFLCSEKMEEVMAVAVAKGESALIFLPFLKEAKIRELAFAAFENGGTQAASPYFPFMKEEDLLRLIAEET